LWLTLSSSCLSGTSIQFVGNFTGEGSRVQRLH
jgi:hypothetical protein